MTQPPNIIKLAVKAAGGREAVAKAFGLSVSGVDAWGKTGRMPADKVRPLCDMGGVFAPDQLLRYIEQRANAEKVAA